MRLFVAGIIKNELPGLLEWIAYHRVLGVSGFLIADNGSTDGSAELLKQLARLGIVTYMDFPSLEGQKPQLPAYTKLLRSCPSTADLLAFIDADEFLMPQDVHTSLPDALRPIFEDENISALALNWANFGSNGELFKEEGLVIERFNRRAPQSFNVHHNFKTIVRPIRIEKFLNPHFAELRYGRYVDAQSRDLILHPKHGNGVSAEVVWSGLRVNHYPVKSLEEFLLGKSQRGSAATANRVKHKAYFKSHDRNDEECNIAKSLSSRVHDEIILLTNMIASLSVVEENKVRLSLPKWLKLKIRWS